MVNCQGSSAGLARLASSDLQVGEFSDRAESRATERCFLTGRPVTRYFEISGIIIFITCFRLAKVVNRAKGCRSRQVHP